MIWKINNINCLAASMKNIPKVDQILYYAYYYQQVVLITVAKKYKPCKSYNIIIVL